MKKDPAQEFAERVADEWFKFEGGKRPWPHVHLITLIASELRAGGWQSGFDPNPDNKLLAWAIHNLPVLTGLATRKP